MKIQKLLIIYLLSNHSAIYASLNDTGITTCSNATQNGLPCPVAGFPGQDAEFGTNSFYFTKLDANGNAMPVTATNHSCVQDNVTGLMWEVKTDDGGLRDKDWMYSWFFNNSYCYNSNRCNTEKFVQDVNATNLCGHNDWRVPNVYELLSIEDYSVYNPSIDEDFFPYTMSDSFWTNAQDAASPSYYSWIVDFNHGDVGSQGGSRYNNHAVRLVRGGQWLLPFSFTDQGNGTVTEQNTGLMWAKCSVGQGATDCSGSSSYLTWQQALQAADSSTLAGYTDWRLPNVKELQTIVDYTKDSPSINTNVFLNTPPSSVWSSSPAGPKADNSWNVYFRYGSVQSTYRGDDEAVRLVRGGRASDPNDKANLESPQQGSYESGIGLIRGWACQAETIEIQIDGGSKYKVAYGTNRGDTQETCGHSATGFGFTYNWNSLSNGTHNLKVFADNVQFADVNFTTTNLDSSYLTGASGQHTVNNFPAAGKTATLKWSEPHQNFVIASATRTASKIMPPVIRAGIPGNLESPQQNSFESGVGLIRGWVCQANSIELQIDNGTRRPVAYGTARGDTAATCNGNPNTGFGYVYNWNALNDGTHNLRLFVNNQEFTNVNFTVTTLGGNYLEGLSRDETFNFNGRNIKVRWATPHQNFVIVP